MKRAKKCQKAIKSRAIKEIWKDEDGYWCTLKKGFVFGGGYNTTVMAQDTLKELKEQFKLIMAIE